MDLLLWWMCLCDKWKSLRDVTEFMVLLVYSQSSKKWMHPGDNNFLFMCKTNVPPTTPPGKDYVGDESRRWPTSLLVLSDEIKMTVTFTTYFFPIETLNRALTCAARLPVRNNDLRDRCDPERWQWHHQYPSVGKARDSTALHRLSLLRSDLEGVLEYLSRSRTLGNRAGTIFQILYVFLNPLGKEK